MLIRKTTFADVSAAAAIYDSARAFMRENGNLHQWSAEYPNEQSILADIARGGSYVCEDDGEIVAVFYFYIGNDPTYDKIFEGEWRSGGEYAVIHRIAVKRHGRGIADFIYAQCFDMHPNIRIDTHRDNIPMQRSLEKNGFEYCGIIYLANGDERLAFQKI